MNSSINGVVMFVAIAGGVLCGCSAEPIESFVVADAGMEVGDLSADVEDVEDGKDVALAVDDGDATLDGVAPDSTLSDAADVTPDTPDSVEGVCPVGMASITGSVGHFCMDIYEAPNVKGEKPIAFATAPEGESWCKARGKRLCSEAQWVQACEGVAKRPYPYGATYKKATCVDDKTWISPNWTTLGTWPTEASKKEAARLYQAEASGSRAGCVSDDGVVDLTGNVAEWVTRSFPNRNNFDHVMKGCYWAGCYGGTPPSCAFLNPAHPGTFRTYEAGFRCCQ